MFSEELQRRIDRDNWFRDFLCKMEQMQAIHNILLLQGELRFGEPSQDVREWFWVIRDFDRLERITVRIFDATSWDDLLATP
jgi:hypothetical protein